MAYKFQMTDAILSGTMAPSNDNAFDLGVPGAEWKDLYIDGTAHLDAINFNGTLISATAAELNYLDNDALTAADITKLAALTATAAELNYLDNDDLSAADLQKLADVTSTAAELNYLDITTLGTAAATKALVADGSANLNASAITFTNLGTVTTVDINGGSIDGAAVGAAAQSTGKFTTLSGSGAATFANTMVVQGAVSTLSSVTAGSSFIIGSADLNEVDMEKLDGITNGTAAASKALVADANVDIAGLRNITGTGAITAGTSFIIGSADLSEVDMEKLDGITNGTGAANKALVLDGSRDVDTINALGIASMANNWTNAGRTVADMGILTTVDINGGSVDGATIGAAAQSSVKATTLSGSSTLSVVGNADFNGTMTLVGVADAAVAVASDSLYFLDSDGLMKRESMVDYAAAIAGVGLLAASGELLVSLDELSAGVVDVANDSFAIVDANDSNVSKKESIADFVAAIAGAGITATNGVLSSDASPTPNNIGNASASMVEGFNYSSAVFDAVRTWTCPASPDAGDKVVVKAPSNAHDFALTIARAGSQTIDGETSVVMSSPNGAITLTYLGSDKWAIS